MVAICEKKVLDALLMAAHTLGGAKDQHEGMGGQNFPEPVSAERFGRRSGRLNRLRGEPSYGFTSRSAVPFGRGRWQEGHWTHERSAERNPNKARQISSLAASKVCRHVSGGAVVAGRSRRQ